MTDQWKSPPKPIVHAWVEMGDLVFDDQTRMTKPNGVPKDVYYDMYQPEVVREYNAEEVVVNCIMKGEGPWDESLISTMKKRDAWLTEQMGQQPVGYGKNYHTVNPKPITWENYEGLNYSISAEGDGSYYAQIDVIDHPELSLSTRKFSDEQSAQWWVRDNYEKLHRVLLAKASRV